MNLKNVLTESLPHYTCTLPYSKIKTKFRPYLVKEEKKLLILEETSTQKEIYNGIIEVLNSCYEKIDFNILPLFEVEYCFLKLRAKSVGEIINPKIRCPITNERHIVDIDINEIDLKITKNDNVIELNKNLKLYLKYPTINDIVETNEDINNLIINCITYIENNEEKVEGKNFNKEELLDFIDHLTVDQYDKIITFYNNMPTIYLPVTYKTTDGVQRELILKGLKDFFS
jgi:hypothetical protein